MKKTVLIYLLSILSLQFFQNKALLAQQIYESEKGFFELKEHFDQLNGPDYNLLNGRQYNLPYTGTSHPYFNSDRYRSGSIVLNGERYDSVLINYDIYDQQLILQVPGNISGQHMKVVLNRELIDHFQIDGRLFRLMAFPETGTSFFQVVGSGDISCLLLWKRKLYRSPVSGISSNKYLKQSRGIYFQKDNQLFPVKNRSSFTVIFDEIYREEIQGFLRREKIRFRSASDEKLGDLVNFCMELTSKG